MSDTIRVLIVEDNEPMQLIFRRLIEPFLEKFGSSEVTVTKKLSEARRIIAKSPFQDMVILDLTLDDATMEQTIQSIHEIEDYSPLVIVSGYSVELIRKLIGDTHHEIISKSSDMLAGSFVSTLIKAISFWTNRRYERQEANIARMRQILDENINGTESQS